MANNNMPPGKKRDNNSIKSDYSSELNPTGETQEKKEPIPEFKPSEPEPKTEEAKEQMPTHSNTVDASAIKSFPLRVIQANGKTYKGYYDEDNLLIYLSDEYGNPTGKRARLKKALPPEETYDDEYDDNYAVKDKAKELITTAQKTVEKAAENASKKKNQLSNDVRSVKENRNNYDKGKTPVGKILLVISAVLVSIILILVGVKYLILPSITLTSTEITYEEGKIMVIEIKEDVVPGDEITEDNLQACNIDSQTYNQIAINGNDLYRWEQKDNIIGMYATEYISAGHYITTNSVTKTYKSPENPWNINSDTLESAEIPINISDFDRTELLIGAKVDLHFEISRKEDNNSETLSTETAGATVMKEESIVTTDSYTIKNVTVSNILTSSGGDLFEIYSALISIPEGNREHYLKNAAKYDKEYVSSITPAKICIFVDKDYASALNKAISNGYTVEVELIDSNDISSTEKKEFFDNEVILMESISEILS